MSLEQIGQVLGAIQRQPAWREQQQFQYLLDIWSEVVGPIVAQQTRPLGLTPQQVLKVATSSSVWCQNLSFERQLILTKLNARLSQTLQDLHFSTRHWVRRPQDSPGRHLEWHLTIPGALSGALSTGGSTGVMTYGGAGAQSAATASQDAATAFQHWSQTIHRRSSQLPSCPRCHCPTPAPELERWSVCSLCAIRRQQR